MLNFMRITIEQQTETEILCQTTNTSDIMFKSAKIFP